MIYQSNRYLIDKLELISQTGRTKMTTQLQKGDVAPQFSLYDQHNQRVSLSDFTGKRVLLYFYPKALTPGCTTQACNLRDHLAEIAQNNVIVIGISPDKPDKLQQFTEKKQLNFTLLSDPDHAIAEKYGAWGPKTFMGKHFDGIIRKSFLIDTNGKIENVFDKFKTSDHHQIVLNYLTQQ